MSTSCTDTWPCVGQRVCTEDGRLGFVRYRGTVERASGEWIGVEWDDPQWGKHSGQVDGRSYFTCRVPNSGSFVRISKLIKPKSFLEALRARYTVFGIAERDLQVSFGGDAKVMVETVGWDKLNREQSQLDRLRVVGLARQGILTADPQGEIKKVAPAIADLDLSENLITDWQVIADICRELEHLEQLYLNSLRLDPPPPASVLTGAFDQLRELSLGNTGISWKEACQLGQSLPKLTSLSLTGNKLTELNGDAILSQQSFPLLEQLALDDNQLSDWQQLEVLKLLPKLQHLNLRNNLLAEISVTEHGFTQLKHINVSDNRIATLETIDQFNAFPSLEALTIHGNPIIDTIGSEKARTVVIARVGQISVLNGSRLDRKERMDSELYYLSYFASNHPDLDAEARQRIFLRYLALCEEYGPPSVDNKPKQVLLDDRLITVTVTLRPQIKAEPTKTITRRILGTLTVRNLKNMLQRVLRVPAHKQQIYCVTKAADEDEMLWIHLDDDMREVNYYNVQNGDEFAVIA